MREWLGAVTSAGFVDYDAGHEAYTLPPEHAVCLTGDTSMNLAQMSGASTFFAGFVPDVVRTFHEGGGIPYERYRPEFTELMDKMNRFTYDEFLVDTYLPRPTVSSSGCARGSASPTSAAAPATASTSWRRRSRRRPSSASTSPTTPSRRAARKPRPPG